MKSGYKYFDLREKLEFEIHTMKPSWWMKNGIAAAFFVLSLTFFLGYIVKYPDRIYGEFRLSSNEPAITIPLAPNFQIDKIFKRNGSELRKKEPILLFGSTTSYSDIVTIDRMLAESLVSDIQFVAFFEVVKDQRFSLGELQPYWTELYGALFEHYEIAVIKKIDSKIKHLKHQINKHRELGRRLNAMLKLNGGEKMIFNKYAFIDSVLSAQGVMSTVDYLQKKEEYIAKKKDWEQHEILLKRNELEILSLMQAVDAFVDEKRERLLRVRFGVIEAFNKLRSEIEGWKQKYLIRSPIDGTLHYLTDVGENKFISPGDAIVITPKEQSVKAIVKIPFLRAGKVRTGQQVHFKLNDYPHREYGYLTGKLCFVSNVAGLHYYLGEVDLGGVVETNYHKSLFIKENMGGVAEIITDDRNILSRIFEPLLYIFRS